MDEGMNSVINGLWMNESAKHFCKTSLCYIPRAFTISRSFKPILLVTTGDLIFRKNPKLAKNLCMKLFVKV